MTATEDMLRSAVVRIEHLHEEREARADDIRDVYAELKSQGFHVPAVKELVKLRRKDPAQQQELQDMLDLYVQALGQSNTPQLTLTPRARNTLTNTTKAAVTEEIGAAV